VSLASAAPFSMALNGAQPPGQSCSPDPGSALPLPRQLRCRHSKAGSAVDMTKQGAANRPGEQP